MTYIIILLITVIPLFVMEELATKNKSKVNIYYLFSIILLILISGLRKNTIGIDFKNYEYYYHNLHTVSFEPGFALLFSVLKYFSVSFVTVKWIFAFGTSSLIGIAVYFLSDKKWLSLLLYQTLYLYVSSFSLLRQFTAMSFVLLSVIFLYAFLHEGFKNKRGKLYYLISILLIIVASLFHYSALFMLLLPFVAIIRNNRNYFYLYFILGVLLFLFRDTLFNWIIFYIFPNKAYYYSFKPEIGIVPVTQLILILINHFFYKRKSSEDEFNHKLARYQFTTNLSIIWLMTIFLFSWFPNLARINMYISLIMATLIPSFMKYKKSTYFILIVVLIAYYTFSLLYRDYQGVYPYIWTWEMI